jgi:hypothetical protein
MPTEHADQLRPDDDDDDTIDVPSSSSDARLIRIHEPSDLVQLSAHKGEAEEFIKARVLILQTLRRASIRATNPENWLLFRTREGLEYAYLQDAGADIVRPLWGIRIYNLSPMQKVVGEDPRDFMYLITGDGECTLTHEIVEQMEGGRSSGEDFCKDKHGAALEMAVRKAARANLDGGITRELAALKNVPKQELEEAWTGTSKTTDRCPRGRGYGSQTERLTGRQEKAPTVTPPLCPHCQTPGVYRGPKDGKGGLYYCPKFKAHEDKKWFVDATEWEKAQTTKAAAMSPGTTKTAKTEQQPPPVGEVFK